MVVAEGRLHRREVTSGDAILDRGDLGPVGLYGEDEAAPHRAAVDQHRAGSAHAVLAPQVGTGEAEPLTQQVGERQPRLDRDAAGHAVHPYLDRGLKHSGPPRRRASMLLVTIARRRACGSCPNRGGRTALPRDLTSPAPPARDIDVADGRAGRGRLGRWPARASSRARATRWHSAARRHHRADRHHRPRWRSRRGAGPAPRPRPHRPSHTGKHPGEDLVLGQLGGPEAAEEVSGRDGGGRGATPPRALRRGRAPLPGTPPPGRRGPESRRWCPGCGSGSAR